MQMKEHVRPDEDLLTPTLAEEDEAAGFAHPWNPMSVVVAAFFAGPLAGGYLVAQNFRRLGLPRHFAPALAAFVALGVVVTGVLMCLSYFGVMASTDEDTRRIVRIATRAATVALALAFTHRQARRFRLYLQSGGRPASLWVSGIVAILVGFVLGTALVLVFGVILVAVAPK